jgi:MFS transporter, FSR family, fosmidomycin resistance protein
MTVAERVTERTSRDGAPRTGPAVRGGIAILVAVSVAHLVNDSYLEMLTPLLPHVRETYGVSIATAGILVAVLSFVGSILQPLLGAVGDHVDRRWLAAIGPALTAVGMSLMGYAPSFGVLALLIVVAGIGSAIFHPAGAAYAVQFSDANKRGLYAALFSAAGTFGLAIGPLVATSMSLSSLPWLIPFGVAVGVISFIITPSTRAVGEIVERRTVADYLAVFRGPIRMLWLVMVMRSIAATAYADMAGFVLTGRGETSHIGTTLAAFNIAAAGGAVIAGRVSDRAGRMRVIRWTVLASLPLILLVLQTSASSWAYYPLVIAVGAMVNAGLPVSVVAAQEFAPGHVATASALMMGFAWGMSGLVFPLVGLLADATTPAMAVQIAVLVLVPAWLFALRIPEPGRG